VHPDAPGRPRWVQCGSTREHTTRAARGSERSFSVPTMSTSKAARHQPLPTALFAAGTIKRIHVNQHVIRRNTKTGDTAPPLSVKTSKGSFACNDVVIHGDSVVRYSPERPLSCGARVWIETRARLSLGGMQDRSDG
jgi:hypothetical protein